MLEICVEDAAGIGAAVVGGADRIELCAALAVGGLTPPASLIRIAAECPLPVHLLARPRDGGFRYGPVEQAMIADDLAAAAEAGLHGVVIGANRDDRTLDLPLLSRWVAHAKSLGRNRGWPLSLTLHRAIDLTPDLSDALEQAVELGFDRVLTSGGQPRATDALDMIGALHRQADGRITILAGSGIDADTVPAILDTGVREVHASCRSPVESDALELELAFGFSSSVTKATDVHRVAALRAILDSRANDLNDTNL